MPLKAKRKILVVEDDLLMSSIVVNKLKMSGFDVDSAPDGQAAVNSLSTNTFDLILLDLTMPWFDGFHVLEEMKKTHVSTPVIIMSNLAGPDDINKAKALGAVNYLVKTSVTPDDIVKEINNSLSQPVLKRA